MWEKVILLFGYGLGTLFLGAFYFFRKSWLRKASLGAIGFGFGFNTWILLQSGFASLVARQIPWANFSQIFLILSWILCLGIFYLELRTRMTLASDSLIPLLGVTTLFSFYSFHRFLPFPGFFSSLVFVFHVVVLLLGWTTFLFSLLSSGLYVLKQKHLKTKQWGNLYGVFPTLEELDQMFLHSLYVGFLFLSLGILSGIYLAHVFWKGLWFGDPKFIGSLFLWVWYFILVLLRRQWGWRGIRFLSLALVGFFLLVGILIFSILWGSSWN